VLSQSEREIGESRIDVPMVEIHQGLSGLAIGCLSQRKTVVRLNALFQGGLIALGRGPRPLLVVFHAFRVPVQMVAMKSADDLTSAVGHVEPA
jgi:hypothetical protein